MPRCTEYIAAEIGIMKAGCVFAPLITDYPDERVEYIKNECNSSVILDKAFVDECAGKAPLDGKTELCDSSEKLINCCIENGIDRNKANIIGLAAEEIAVNISRYGYKSMKRNFIDISLSQAENKLILRIRDDGVPFDPTQYKSEEKDMFILGGINLIKKTAAKLSYIRVLNMNNTIIDLNAD